jgi:hypothetical protein
MKQILLFVLAAVTLIAADATGKWTGNLVVPSDEGEQSRPAHLVLKQEGTALTGTAGPDANNQHPIEKGKADNGVLTFEVPTGETIMRFSLKQEDDEIKGEVTRERDGETQKAKLAVKREE